MKCGLAEEEIEDRGVVCLYDEEKDFFCRDPKYRRPNYGVWRIRPDARVNQVGVPRRGGDDSDLLIFS